MLWRNRRSSGNVIDRRGMGGPISLGSLILGAVVYYLMGGNPIEYVAQNTGTVQRQEASSKANDDEKKFVSVVLADTEDVWNDVFKRGGGQYREPRLVLFTGVVQSACGRASSAVGPFYCPGDQQVYLDLGFFKELTQTLGAGGDFAAAYVIAHEVGHHVQNLFGISDAVHQKQQGLSQREKNRLSVQIELEADCLAGVWAARAQKAKNILETGDIEEGLNAASAVGDDKLQKAQRGEVVPDSFTHGTSAQRVSAFKEGLQSSNPQTCLDSYSRP